MKYLIIIFIVLYSMMGQSQIKMKDDTKHFYAGFTIAVGSAEVINQVIDRPGISALIGSALGTGAGIFKEEVIDKRMHRGVYNKGDMAMTTWGAICGGMVVRVHFDLQIKKRNKLHKEDYE